MPPLFFHDDGRSYDGDSHGDGKEVHVRSDKHMCSHSNIILELADTEDLNAEDSQQLSCIFWASRICSSSDNRKRKSLILISPG